MGATGPGLGGSMGVPGGLGVGCSEGCLEWWGAGWRVPRGGRMEGCPGRCAWRGAQGWLPCPSLGLCVPPESFVGAGDAQRCGPPSPLGCAAQRHGQGLTRSSPVQASPGMGLGGTQPVPRWHGGVRAGEGGSGDLRCGRTERESTISSSGWAERKKTYLQQKAGLRNSAALLGQRKLSLK